MILEFLLWFAWKIVLLQYHKQRSITRSRNHVSCDLLEKSYFCSITNSVHHWYRMLVVVVICLKNRTFAISQTAQPHDAASRHQLWFAWKIVLLQYHKQRVIASLFDTRSCDLLEKSYFCSITNSHTPTTDVFGVVVICLKNRTFAVSQTAYGRGCSSRQRLWFAWKIVLLQYHKQLRIRHIDRTIGCDLLEKSYFCSITNSRLHQTHHHPLVVICLKNRTFAVSQTASVRVELYLLGCDLLEKSYFCSITNSLEELRWSRTPVVICLKNRTFAVSQTALSVSEVHSASCDLLEKSYFCSITNSK